MQRLQRWQPTLQSVSAGNDLLGLHEPDIGRAEVAGRAHLLDRDPVVDERLVELAQAVEHDRQIAVSLCSLVNVGMVVEPGQCRAHVDQRVACTRPLLVSDTEATVHIGGERVIPQAAALEFGQGAAQDVDRGARLAHPSVQKTPLEQGLHALRRMAGQGLDAAHRARPRAKSRAVSRKVSVAAYSDSNAAARSPAASSIALLVSMRATYSVGRRAILAASAARASQGTARVGCAASIQWRATGAGTPPCCSSQSAMCPCRWRAIAGDTLSPM